MSTDDMAAGFYPTDLPYPDRFHRETAPGWLRTAAAALGQRVGPAEVPLRYLDLGCGAGLGIALLAAANPHSQFTGVDFNPRHIAEGQALADGLPNLTLLAGEFARLAQDGSALGGPFDIIVAHGVYSWIAPELQAAVRQIVATQLAPGGMLYLHYTTHPGQSAFAGAQALLRRVADGADGSTAGLAAGLQVAAALAQGGAGYFASQPAVAHLLANGGDDAHYLAHDLLPQHWSALHVGDVIDALAGAGCAYLGSATLIENVDALSLPAGTQPIIGRIRELRARETARDLARNQAMRRDLYRLGWDPLPPEAYGTQAQGLRFIALPGPAMQGGDLVLPTPIGPVTVSEATVGPLRARLRQGPAGIAECGLPPGDALRTMLALVHAGEAHLLGPQVDGTPALALNARLAQRGGRGWLAAPAIGSALEMDGDGMALAGALLRDPALRGPALAEAAGLQVAPDLLRGFEQHVLPRWQQLGIVPN